MSLGNLSGVKMLVFLILMILPVAADDWTVNGHLYRHVRLGGQTTRSVSIVYDEGTAQFNFCDLPSDLQKRFGYDPARSKTDLEAEREQAKQLEERRAEALASDDKERLINEAELASHAKWSAIKQSLVRLHGTVIQKLPNGYLIRSEQSFSYTSNVGLYKTGTAFATPSDFNAPILGDATVFVTSPRDLVSDDTLDVLVYPSGEFSYTSVLGASSTVRQYSEYPSSKFDAKSTASDFNPGSINTPVR